MVLEQTSPTALWGNEHIPSQTFSQRFPTGTLCMAN